jgi:hypothetical protein
MWRLIFVLVLMALVLIIKYLPWYVPVGLLVAFVLSMKFLGRWFIRWVVHRLFLIPFKAKGAVLRDAGAKVHAIESTLLPPSMQPAIVYHADGEKGAEEDKLQKALARAYFRLDVTITPQEPTGPFQHWEPGELRLGLPEKKWDEEDDSCEIKSLEIEQDAQFQADEGYKYAGPRRLRLLIGVLPGVERLTFRYYLEEFGEVTLPTRETVP